MPKSTQRRTADKVRSREDRRIARAERLPPMPIQGGAYVVDADGKLVLQDGSTRIEPLVKEA